MEIKNKQDAENIENTLQQHMEELKNKTLSKGVPWSYEAEDGKGFIREYPDGKKEYFSYDE